MSGANSPKALCSALVEGRELRDMETKYLPSFVLTFEGRWSWPSSACKAALCRNNLPSSKQMLPSICRWALRLSFVALSALKPLMPLAPS